MTREEAITILKDISWQMGSVKRWENIEAIDMAIEALSAENPKADERKIQSGDLIKRAEAVHKPDYSYEADMAKRWLRQAEAVQGWIPCSERLPSEDGCYLVCINFEYDNMDVLKWADGWNCFRYPDGKVSRESEIDGADIIAWMPLPKPYKGGDSE